MPTIAEFVFAIQDDGSVLVYNFTSEVGAHKAAATTVQTVMPGSQVVDDPWEGTNATSQRQPQTQQQQSGQWQQTQQMQQPAQVQAQPAVQAPVRYCAHGQMNHFPNGKYGPFYACPLDRNDPNKCKTQKG